MTTSFSTSAFIPIISFLSSNDQKSDRNRAQPYLIFSFLWWYQALLIWRWMIRNILYFIPGLRMGGEPSRYRLDRRQKPHTDTIPRFTVALYMFRSEFLISRSIYWARWAWLKGADSFSRGLCHYAQIFYNNCNVTIRYLDRNIIITTSVKTMGLVQLPFIYIPWRRWYTLACERAVDVMRGKSIGIHNRLLQLRKDWQ